MTTNESLARYQDRENVIDSRVEWKGQKHEDTRHETVWSVLRGRQTRPQRQMSHTHNQCSPTLYGNEKESLWVPDSQHLCGSNEKAPIWIGQEIRTLTGASTPFSKISDVVHFLKFDVFSDEKDEKWNRPKCCAIGRFRRSMLRAFGIRTNVICDLCLQKFPGKFFQAASSRCFPWRCKIARTSGKGKHFHTKTLGVCWSQGRNSIMLARVLVLHVWSLLAGPLGGTTAHGSNEVNMCWQLLPGAVIEGQGFSLGVGRMASNESPVRYQDGENVAEPRAEWKGQKHEDTPWGSFGRPSWNTDSCSEMPHTQTKSVFSYAMAVMDKIEGWEEEGKWVGSRFAAFMWIYTTAAIWNGQENPQEYFMQRFRSIMEEVNWLCDDVLDGDEWVFHIRSKAFPFVIYVEQHDFTSVCLRSIPFQEENSSTDIAITRESEF